MNNSEIFIVGANGQLGTALREKYPGAQKADIDEVDITKPETVLGYDWSGIKFILNAAAYTNVDGAESDEGRRAAWQVNASAVANLAEVAMKHDITVVHISTDYVFDGVEKLHTEDEPFAPLSVYGASKAAGDIAVSQAPKHYILRTSWVIGEGDNFVRSMFGLTKKDISPAVVADQFGRLTFTGQLVDAIDHLLTTDADFGTYNVSNSGDIASWADMARAVYAAAGRDDLTVSNTTAEEYFRDKQPSAERPVNSGLDLAKIQATGLVLRDWRDDLIDYVKKETSHEG